MASLLGIILTFVQTAWKILLVVLVAGLLIFWVGKFLSPSDDLEKSDAIVAISGGDTKARTQAAIDLYKDGWSKKLIFSGAALDPLSPSNARVMREMAVRSGVPNEDILIDEEAQDTAQNALKSRELINQLKAEQLILVTSAYHQRRASMEFEEAIGRKINIINFPVDDNNWSGDWWMTPRGWWLTISEIVKIIIIWLRIKL